MRIDSHQHFWRYNPEEYGWITDKMNILKKDYLPEDLSPLLREAGFDGTVAVQARQSVEETAWLLKLSDEHDFIKGVVGWVDLRSPRVTDELGRFAPHPKLKGVRHVVHDEPDDDFMLKSEFLRGLGRLTEHGLTYDLLLFPRHLPVAKEVVRKFPGRKFVLDHVAKPDIKGHKLSPWDGDIRELASFPEVYCKLSGMVTEAAWKEWRYEDFVPVLDVIFEAFGPDRLMVGSDWPVCTLAGAYSEVMRIVTAYLESHPPKVRDKILGENAKEFYGLA